MEEGRPCRLLIIEDNSADVLLLRQALAQSNLQTDITVFNNGTDALAYIRRLENEDGSKQPDAILLDMNLPGIGGEEILNAIRKSLRLASVPLAVLSSTFSAREKSRMLQLGLTNYLTKPADLDEFLRIGTFVKDMLGGKSACHGK